MSIANALRDLWRRRGMRRYARRQAVHQRYVDLRRVAACSDDPDDHARAGKALLAYHRRWLPVRQRELFEAQDEVARLRVELARRDRSGHASHHHEECAR